MHRLCPHEGKVNLRSTRSRVGLVVEELHDKTLSLSLAHGDSATIFYPNRCDVVVGPLNKSESDAMDVGGGRLEGTHGKTLLNNLLEARQVFGLVFGVNDDLDLGRGGSH